MQTKAAKLRKSKGMIMPNSGWWLPGGWGMGDNQEGARVSGFWDACKVLFT